MLTIASKLSPCGSVEVSIIGDETSEFEIMSAYKALKEVVDDICNAKKGEVKNGQ